MHKNKRQQITVKHAYTAYTLKIVGKIGCRYLVCVQSHGTYVHVCLCVYEMILVHVLFLWMQVKSFELFCIYANGLKFCEPQLLCTANKHTSNTEQSTQTNTNQHQNTKSHTVSTNEMDNFGFFFFVVAKLKARKINIVRYIS